ncbi:hypothetical protein EW146_g9002, partial [Bondarzewia mesenterica]
MPDENPNTRAGEFGCKTGGTPAVEQVVHVEIIRPSSNSDFSRVGHERDDRMTLAPPKHEESVRTDKNESHRMTSLKTNLRPCGGTNACTVDDL